MFITASVKLFVLCLCLVVNESKANSLATDGQPGENCAMGGDVSGRCEDIEICFKDDGVVQMSGQVTLCQPQSGKVYVCCRKPQQIAEELCATWATYWRGKDHKCIRGSPLIVGGVDADPGEFPHIALVGQKESRDSINWFCGGSLISPHFVLTAAHCVLHDELDYYVRLGEHDRSFSDPEEMLPKIKGVIPKTLYRADELQRDTTENAPVKQQIRVLEIIRHPHYQQARKYHDIALLRLAKPATLTRRVLPACLPTKTEADIIGDNVTVAGWGSTATGVSELPNVLQKVNIPVKRSVECQIPFATRDRITAAQGLLEDQICAGDGERDSCGGDSGGPLMKQEPRDSSVCEQTVVGVVSFGRLSCGQFGIYGRVSSYLDWITSYIAPNTSS